MAIITPAKRCKFKYGRQNPRTVSTVDATIKYAKRWKYVTNPSIRSKFDQKLFVGFSPKIAEMVRILIKATNAPRSQLFFGRYAGSINARTTHAENIISTTIRNAKFFPTINGKKVVCERITNGINGTKINPVKTTAFAKIL